MARAGSPHTPDQADRAMPDRVEPDDVGPDGDEPASGRDRVGPPPGQPPALSTLEMGRWAWRQLTSMRTALVLLLLLALAALPGSVFPQRPQDPVRVTQFFSDHPAAAPWLDRLGLFDVYASAWFAAVYLLLLVSLVGCVLPRVAHHARALRTRPPAAPRNLSRLPVARSYRTATSAPAVLDAAESQLKRRRFRYARSGDALSAEKGYWRETGNLVFHLSLLGFLVALAMRSLFGFHGSMLLPVGDTFADTVTAYDDFTPGRSYDPANLPPFELTLTKFDVTFQTKGPTPGAPEDYTAHVSYRTTPGGRAQTGTIKVNHPLNIDGTKIYLIANGYAPRFTVRDGKGAVVFRQAVPFLPQDTNFTSMGVVKVPDAQPSQLGFQGFFLPTAYVDPTRGPISLFPDARHPAVFLSAWQGDLGLNSGVPQSVYQLDTGKLSRLGIKALGVGDTYTLPNGLGSITFDGWARWANFQVAHDPGINVAFGSAVVALAGLMAGLFLRRRRVFVRVTPGPDGGSLVEVAALARSESPGLAEEVDALLDDLRAAAPPEPDPDGVTADQPHPVPLPREE